MSDKTFFAFFSSSPLLMAIRKMDLSEGKISPSIFYASLSFVYFVGVQYIVNTLIYRGCEKSIEILIFSHCQSYTNETVN